MYAGVTAQARAKRYCAILSGRAAAKSARLMLTARARASGNHGVERANGLARLQDGRGRCRFPCTDTLRLKRHGEHGCRRRLHAGDALPEEGRSHRNAGGRRFVP
jgi:hypothetical protein